MMKSAARINNAYCTSIGSIKQNKPFQTPGEGYPSSLALACTPLAHKPTKTEYVQPLQPIDMLSLPDFRNSVNFSPTDKNLWLNEQASSSLKAQRTRHARASREHVSFFGP